MSRIVSVGQRFERLLVIELIPDSKNPKARCVCDCGTVVTPQRGALKNGRAKSCGCLRRELLAKYVDAVRLTPEERMAKRADGWRKWVAANPVRARQINNAATRRYHARHPEKARDRCRDRRARLVGAAGVVSPGIGSHLQRLQQGKCACCRTRLRPGNAHLDHVKPLAKGGLHEDSNLQVLCASCNLSKGKKEAVDFMRSRGFLL